MTELNESYVADLEERLAALEFALENEGWQLLTQQAEQEFTRAGLREITDLCRVMYLKNPVIQRGVDVKKLYVWGQGWTVRAADAPIQEVIDEFLTDNKNDDAFGGHEARMQLEVELQTDGNLFFCLFVNQISGRVRIRTIPFDQIRDVVCNPDDAKEPWYYLRVWTEQRFNTETGGTEFEQRTTYYPDWRYDPVAKPDAIGGHPVLWDKPIYHVRVGGYSNWKFGLSEIYDAIDWARAYKEFLEDWASIVRSYRRFAWQVSTTGGRRGITAAKSKLNTTLGQGGTDAETNPPPVTGSTFIAGEGNKLEPVRTQGATVAAEDGRRLLLMVAASFGLPETFFGDASIGSLATARSLDRPTELMMEDRQQLWRDVTLNLLRFVLFWQVKAPQGALSGLGRIQDEVEDDRHAETVSWNDGIDGSISIDFPPLLQHNTAEMISATVQAATLGAQGTPAGTIDLPTLSRILLTTLGVDDVEEIVERLFPGGEEPEPAQPGEGEPPPRPQAEAMMVEAVRELRDRLANLGDNDYA